MRRTLVRHRLFVSASFLLALVGLVVFIVPVTAEGPSIDASTSTIETSWSTTPLSHTYPFPYPYPRQPVSGTIRISGTIYVWPYPFPYWCLPPSAFPPAPPGLPSPVPPTPVPSPTPGGAATAATYRICPQIINKVPAAVTSDALAQPWMVYGYNIRQNPNVPAHPMWNPLRTSLTILDYNKPYSICNPVVWKVGCP